jgi:hypothetical protein
MNRRPSLFLRAILVFFALVPKESPGRIQFAGPIDYKVGRGSGPVAAADFDTDGDLDLAIGNYNHGTLSILLNQGDGSFEAGSQTVIEVGIAAVVAEDFSGDGIPDVAAVSDGVFDRTVTVLINRGSGELEPVSSIVIFAISENYYLHPRSMVVDDLDGDGDLDFAIANETTQLSSSFVSVLLNDGNGSMGETRNYPADTVTPREPQSLAAADIDRDGDIDLLTINRQDSVLILYNGGSGTFSLPTRVSAGSNPEIPLTAIAVADLNGDTYTDVMTADGEGWSVYSLINDGSGSLSAPSSFCALARIGTLIAGDFDGDGDVDLASPSISLFPQSPTFILILANDGTGLFDREEDLAIGYGDSFPEWGLAEDLDRDGDIDLGVVDSFNGSLLIFHNQLVPTPSSADLNEDRSIDFLDLLQIRSRWFWTTGPAGKRDRSGLDILERF